MLNWRCLWRLLSAGKDCGISTEKRGMVMIYQYRTHGTCSREIDLEIEDGIIRRVKFHGGCAGNLAGISKSWRDAAQKVIDTFPVIRCGIEIHFLPGSACARCGGGAEAGRRITALTGEGKRCIIRWKTPCACGSGWNLARSCTACAGGKTAMNTSGRATRYLARAGANSLPNRWKPGRGTLLAGRPAYQMPRHGFARRKRFFCVDESNDRLVFP